MYRGNGGNVYVTVGISSSIGPTWVTPTTNSMLYMHGSKSANPTSPTGWASTVLAAGNTGNMHFFIGDTYSAATAIMQLGPTGFSFGPTPQASTFTVSTAAAGSISLSSTTISIRAPTLTLSAASGTVTIGPAVVIATGGMTVSGGGLRVSGGVTVTGGAIAYTSLSLISDRRLKSDITPISNSLAKVSKIRGVYFRWVTDDTAGFIAGDDRRHVGLIAQDVLKVIPEAVVSQGDGGYMGVDYASLISVAFEAIRELNAKVESLEELNAKVESLEVAILQLRQVQAELIAMI